MIATLAHPVVRTAPAAAAAGGSQPALVFASAWPTIGTNAAAVGQNGMWTSTSNPGANQCEVIAATGLDFPTDNVLAITYSGATAWGVTGTSILPALADGGHLYGRMYYRSAVRVSAVSQTIHPIGTRPDLDPLAFTQSQSVNGAAFDWYPAISYDPDFVNGTHRFHVDGGLAVDTTYRFEWHIHRVSSTVFRLEFRIYNSAGTLLKSGSAFDCEYHAHDLDDDADISIEAENWASVRGWEISYQGGSAVTPIDADHNKQYYGAVAFSIVDWPGPYVPGEAAA